MKELILIKNGEIALKGLNRFSFEDKLISNMKRRVSDCGKFRFYKAQSTMYCEPMDEEADLDEAFRRLTKVFGIVGLSRALIVEKDFEKIQEAALPYLEEQLLSAKSFKVMAKRADKTFPYNSPQICTQLGGRILEAYPHLTVDVHNPELIVSVEIRDFAAYIHANQIDGAGGMPLGTSGRAALLISGGIDSPVAGFMMAKRGVSLIGVHFVSPPYTSGRAKLKVVQLTQKMCEYAGKVDLHVVGFTEIQEQIKKNCPEELFTIIMRRYMMRIAQRIARDNDCDALVTGESVAQVASQTMKAIACTDAVCEIPVFRPVIGMDKEEIVQISRKIDTYEISIQPYEDCCTVFTPRHPKTKPRLADVLAAEQALDEDALIERAMQQIEVIPVNA